MTPSCRMLAVDRTVETAEVCAAGVRPPTLRVIDAIHLASALAIRQELTAFVAYDKRLLAAARTAGLPTASPA